MSSLPPQAAALPTPLLLVATLGPASEHLVEEVVNAGASCLRFNASHLSPDHLHRSLDRLRSLLPQVPVIVDLQGAKMRIGRITDQTVQSGDLVHIVLHSLSPSDLCVPHPELFASAKPGDTISIDDDRIRMTVSSASDQFIEAVSQTSGVLRANKGINVLEHPVRLHDLSATDQHHIQAARPFSSVSFAVSFVADGHEVSWVRTRAPNCPVIAKIERREAIENLNAIRAAFDAVWICRGDLGAQIGQPALARWFSTFIPSPGHPPTLLAGQVLEHLTSHPSPTRSELCHLFDVISRGYSGIVLSDETAIGVDPIGAVRTASNLLNSLS